MKEREINISEDDLAAFLLTHIAILRAENKELHAKVNVLLEQIHPDLAKSLNDELSSVRSANYEQELQSLADLLEVQFGDISALLKALSGQ